MKYPNFQKGQILESKTHGMVEFKGMDCYMGQTTYHFRSHTYGGDQYWLPESLHRYLDIEDDKDKLAKAEARAQELAAQLAKAQKALSCLLDSDEGMAHATDLDLQEAVANSELPAIIRGRVGAVLQARDAIRSLSIQSEECMHISDREQEEDSRAAPYYVVLGSQESNPELWQPCKACDGGKAHGAEECDACTYSGKVPADGHSIAMSALEKAAQYWSDNGYHNTANKIREYATLNAPQVQPENDYEALEREHLGNPDLRTGIYHPDNQIEPPVTAIQCKSLPDCAYERNDVSNCDCGWPNDLCKKKDIELEVSIAKGTDVWKDVPEGWLEDLRGNPVDDFAAFALWKNYPLPPLNADGRFDKDWLNREFIAFKAGRSAQVTTGPTLEAQQEARQDRRPNEKEGTAALSGIDSTHAEGWVSVDERLPEYGVEVLVYRPLAHESHDPHFTIDSCRGYAQRSPQGVTHFFARWCHPSHWMPLPPAPKANLQEGE